MWNLPGLGIEPLSSALAGGFLTIGPLGKPSMEVFDVPLWAVPGTEQMLRTSCQVSGQMRSFLPGIPSPGQTPVWGRLPSISLTCALQFLIIKFLGSFTSPGEVS